MQQKIKKIINKKNKSKIVSLTAYSKNIATILDDFCDIILVGDSLGSVLYNYKSTREVSLDTMIEHSKSVRMGIKKSLMVVDMPYNTYRNSKEALKKHLENLEEAKRRRSHRMALRCIIRGQAQWGHATSYGPREAEPVCEETNAPVCPSK